MEARPTCRDSSGYSTRQKPSSSTYSQPSRNWRMTSEPNDSRASSETSDSTTENRRNSASLNALLRASAHAAMSSQDHNEARPQAYHPAPRSPPYQENGEQRLSLPPLKTVLGDTLASPPATPRTHLEALQLSPCEPMYTTRTYKPPSLYPNKKPRTDASVSAVPRAIPFQPLHVHEAVEVPCNRTLQPEHSARLAIRDVRLPPSTHEQSHYASVRRAAAPVRVAADQYGHAAHRYEAAGVSNRTFAEAQAPTSDRQYHIAHERRPSISSRRDSIAQYEECPPYQQEALYHDGRAGDYNSAVEREHPRYRQLPFHPPNPGYSTRFYERPSMFMGGSYEYQQGKARKRSNLPKQSTEIMKTWFDQNIANPYPSEEQKAIFSSATGISMTQVSNWFINHRRRCPELRDKRDKSRGAIDDES